MLESLNAIKCEKEPRRSILWFSFNYGESSSILYAKILWLIKNWWLRINFFKKKKLKFEEVVEIFLNVRIIIILLNITSTFVFLP